MRAIVSSATRCRKWSTFHGRLYSRRRTSIITTSTRTAAAGSRSAAVNRSSSPGARWGAKMTLQIWNTEQLLAIRALRSALKGRANPVLLPNFDRHHLPVPNPAATFKAAFPIGTTDVIARLSP